MRKLRAGFALAFVMLVCAAPAAAVRDTLVIGMPTDVPIFDTHKATGLHNGSILNQVSEPLVLLTTKGEVLPWLVDGTPVNAEAVRFSLERFRKHSIGKATLAIVESIAVVDEGTRQASRISPSRSITRRDAIS
jgi:ABC-type transport system substrate-binding protein